MEKAYEDVVNAVLSNTQDEAISTTIRLFNPLDTTHKNFSRLNQKAVPKQSLEETSNFLHAIKEKYPTATLRLRDTSVNKADLARDIVEWLSELIPQTCLICTHSYISAEYGDDEEYLTCFLCNRKSHAQCYKDHPTDVTIGIVYLCSLCTQQKVPPKEETSVTPKDSDEGQKDENEESNKEIPGSPEIDQPEPQPESKPMCPKYKYGRCPNYETCKDRYDHPRRCRNMLNKGKCRFRDKCRYFHPKLCTKSISDRKCTFLECPFFHISGTIRYEETHQTDPNSNPPVPDQEYHNSGHQIPQPPQNTFLPEQMKQMSNSIKQLTNLVSTLMTSRQTPINHVQDPNYQMQYQVNQNHPHVQQLMNPVHLYQYE